MKKIIFIASIAKHCSVMLHIVTSVIILMSKFTLNVFKISAMFKRGSNKSVCVLLILSSLFITSCGTGARGKENRGNTKESLIEEIQKRGVLKVGMSTFVPWAMRDKNGELVGFEIDVARRLAKDMGVEIEFIPTKWSGMIPAILTGKFDVIIGGMGIRPERNLKVNFSIPYDYTGMAIVAHKEIAGGLSSFEEFNREDFTIAARIGTSSVDAIKKRMPLAKIKLFDDESQAVQELLNKKAHAVVASTPLPAFQAIKNSDRLYVPIKGTFTKEPIGFALRKGDVDTLNYFNSWIIWVESDGWFQERKEYWFETRDWAYLVE